jgi:PleD family two-component response regulator
MLIVDDQPDNLDLLERIFRDEFDVDRALDPHTALALLSDGPYEVIITDQRMPDLSGIDLLVRSIEHAPDAVRIVLTGYPDLHDAIAAVNEAHAFRFFTKPLDVEQLAQAVRTATHTLDLERENRRLTDELRTKSTLLEGLLAEKEGLIESRVHMRTRQLESELGRLKARAVIDESGALATDAFRERVEAEVARAARFALPVSIVVLAAPLLPVVEQEHGREMAEQVARTVAEILRLGSRRFDAVGRLDTERFAVLLPHSDPPGARARLERLLTAFARFPVAAHEDLLGGGLDIIGAAVSYPDDATTPDELVEAAQRALDAVLPQPEGGGMLY